MISWHQSVTDTQRQNLRCHNLIRDYHTSVFLIQYSLMSCCSFHTFMFELFLIGFFSCVCIVNIYTLRIRWIRIMRVFLNSADGETMSSAHCFTPRDYYFLFFLCPIVWFDAKISNVLHTYSRQIYWSSHRVLFYIDHGSHPWHASPGNHVRKHTKWNYSYCLTKRAVPLLFPISTFLE